MKRMKLSMLKIAGILRFFASVLIRCWALSGGAILGFVLLYWAYGGIFAFCLLCFAITGILYRTEDQLLYHPDQPAHSRVFVPAPSMFGLLHENLLIRSLDGTLIHAFLIKQTSQKSILAPTLVFFHGNAGNMGHRLHNAIGLYKHLGCNLLMVDYRGYGMSEGTPSEEGLYMDSQAAINFLSNRSDINQSEIIVFGRSLGGSVAIDLACRPEFASKIWCVIVENTFTSIPDMANVLLRSRIVRSLPLFCYKNKFMTLSKVGRMTCATLFISGLADNLVPPIMMSQLHQRCGSPHKQLLCFDTGTHNETWNCPGYYHAIKTFIQELRQTKHHHQQPSGTVVQISPPPSLHTPSTSTNNSRPNNNPSNSNRHFKKSEDLL